MTDQEVSGKFSGQALDSVLVILDGRLADTALSGRLRVCHLAVYGQLLIQNGRLSDAYRYCKMANDIAVEKLAEDDLVRGYAQAAYGCYLDFYQSPELALQPLQQSLPGLTQLSPDNKFPYQDVYKATLRTEIVLGLLADARHHHDANVAMIIARKDTIRLARDINTYGFFLQQAGYHREAIMAFDEGLNLFNAPTREVPRLWYVNLLESKAHSLVENEQLEAGITNLEQAYYTRKEIDRYPWAMQALGYIINYLMESGQYQRAYQFFRKEQAYFAKESELSSRNHRLYQSLGKLMVYLGHKEESETYFSTYNAYAANLLLPKAEARLEAPNALSEHILLQQRAQEQAAQIDQLEIDQLRKEVRLRQYGLALLGLSSGLLLLILLGYRWYRQRNEEERQRAEADRRRILKLENENLKYSVATQERDLKRLAADNRLRTKLKRDILKQIEAINQLPTGEKEKQLGKLKAELSTKIEEQEVFSQLQDQIETINAAFEDQLRERIPGITGQEIRYCSLLRLGMNNQQIAQLLNKSDATIRTYKHRITKKAGLQGRNALQLLVDRM